MNNEIESYSDELDLRFANSMLRDFDRGGKTKEEKERLVSCYEWLQYINYYRLYNDLEDFRKARPDFKTKGEIAILWSAFSVLSDQRLSEIAIEKILEIGGDFK